MKKFLKKFGFGYSKEELREMSVEELKEVKDKQLDTAVVAGGVVIGSLVSFAIGSLIGKSKGKEIGYKTGYDEGTEWKEKEKIGLYNSGLNDMYNGLNSRWDKIPDSCKIYVDEHIDLANKGLVANGR